VKTPGLSAGNVLRRVPDHDDFMAGEVAAGMLFGAGDRTAEVIPPLAIRAEGAEGEVLLDASRGQLQRGAPRDVAREQGNTNVH
jgi:hypothetical protein